METKKCHQCGDCTLDLLENTSLGVMDRFVGPLLVSNVTYYLCSQCGYTLYTPQTMDAVLEAAAEKLRQWLLDRPVREFYTSKETADALGISMKQLAADHRIARGYIFKTKVGVQWLYLKESVHKYAADGDGRFELFPRS